MFLIRSTRSQGTMVEIISQGKTLYAPICGMGTCTSDLLTDDIKNQKKMGFIVVSHVDTKPMDALIAAIEELDTEPEDQFEVAPVETAIEENPESEAVEWHSRTSLKKLTKDELIGLAGLHDVDIDEDDTKKDILATMCDYDIPKE